MTLQLLPAAARQLLQIELTDEQQQQFATYARELVEWNENRANLTAITEPVAVETRHFLDSLTILKATTLNPGAKVIDVGTGAGFPGLPLRIVQPDIRLTLMEATGKKTAFLQHMADELHMPDVHVLRARAEEAGQITAHREAYDLVLARSVAHMPVLAEYLLPLAKIGGVVIAMKGESAANESQLAERAFKTLGGKLRTITAISLPNLADPHYLVVIDKVAATPGRYPRKPGEPSKKPL